MPAPTQLPDDSDSSRPTPPQPVLLPGIAGIALWMLIQSAIGAFGVISHSIPPLALVLCALFAGASFGLLRLRRWGWALTLAAAFLTMSYCVYMLLHTGQAPFGFIAALNLIFFLYLVRPDVLSRLK